MKPRKHAELIKAWADGAGIQFLSSMGPRWKDSVSAPHWISSSIYRIKPDCEYAIEKIRELGGDEAVELYKYWLGGGTLQGEVFKCSTVEDFLPPSDNPFVDFNVILSCTNVRKKKKTVKQVLWVRVFPAGVSRQWVEDGDLVGKSDWHKVPTCTREVEV